MKIRTPSRIHITLIDLNGEIGRIDGGVGLALEEPYVSIKAKESDHVVIKGESENFDRYKTVAEKFREVFGSGIEIKILRDFKSHVGLGSGTQISLAVGKAFTELNGIEMSVREIAEFVGRGGTSGIGVAAFEFGGFIVDGGHSVKEKNTFLPSSFSKAKPAPILVRYDFPDWDLYVFIPESKGFFGKREVDLFKKNTPLKIEEVRELCHIILMKLMPSVVEEDLEEFAKAIYRIQYIGFKRAEINQYGDLIYRIIEEAKDYGAVGMSSTGPSVYFIGEEGGVSVIKDIFKERNVRIDIIKTKAKNRGAEIEV
uniref:Beta-ribofuranosylaminobenzene 5'-phosphate synthase n=1 Tax=Geoglobus ahangari TaxID=113653 RepID=A0A7C4W3B1_9EURY